MPQDILIDESSPVIHHRPVPRHIRWDGPVIAALITVMSLVYAAAMFRGLEHHSGYHGNAYQALHPGSFPRDEHMRPGRPTMLSLYYVIVRLVGPWWLDDRFTIIVFALIAAIALAGLDKIAQLFGARRLSERVTVLAILLLEHKILSNHALLIDNYEFNATTMSGPFIIWLLYVSLAGKRPFAVAALSALALGVSIKNAWLPVVLAGVVVWKEWPQAILRRLAIAAAIGAIIAGLGYYYLVVRSAHPTDPKLFDYIMARMDDREANPFLDPLAKNLLLAGLCAAAAWAGTWRRWLTSRIRLMFGACAAIWVIGGLYLSAAPDALKIPHLIPFDVARALWWPQYLAYVTLTVWTLRRLERARVWPEAAACTVALYALALVHTELRIKLIAIAVVANAGLLAWFWLRARAARPTRQPAQEPWARHEPRRWQGDWLKAVAASLAIGVLSTYAVGSVRHRLEALRYLAHHGVIGENGGAKWVGVDRYLQERTPESATVVALADADAFGHPRPLEYDGALRTRGGRSMPLGHRAAFYLDYATLQWWEDRVRQMDGLVESWTRHDLPAVAEGLEVLGWPDYLVVPTDQTAWLKGQSLGYSTETVIQRFTILRRQDSS